MNQEPGPPVIGAELPVNPQRRAPGGPDGTRKPRGYFAQTADPLNSMILVAPLFVIYQLGILFTDGWKNGADFVTARIIQLVDGNPLLYTAINMTVMVAVIIAWSVRRKRGAMGPRTSLLLVVESGFYATFMGGVAARMLMKMGLQPPLSMAGADVPLATERNLGLVDAVVLSIGAGTYEELLFRLILLGGALAIFPALFGKVAGPLLAILSTSIIFSACHYVPLGMDPWQLWSFTYRAVLGVFLAGLFLFRGFAVAVYTHTLYDIFILVPQALMD